MAHNSYKINDVEKMFLGRYTSICTAKNDFWTISMKYLPMGEGSSSAMPYHFTHYERHVQKNICENINMKTDKALSSCRCV